MLATAIRTLQAHRATAPHGGLLVIHLHPVPVSSVAMKAPGPDNAQTQVSLPGHAPSAEDHTGSRTVSGPCKDRPHPFLNQPKAPARISSASPLKTDSAL
ncbi:transcription factor NF-E4 [Sapajus apella]|uniref:Transcription factor NF-E4 n=1 Tax=Sapajus apella TaxID=9515 RepID=A0A6J3ERE3_SAPAP|nr:transcription factor NF-E4 [Sapajus apella]